MSAVGVVKTSLRSGGRTPRRRRGAGRRERRVSLPAPACSRTRSPPTSGPTRWSTKEGPARRSTTATRALWQGETAIRADVITIDQDNGDLVAVGSARSTLVFDERHLDGPRR